MMPRNQVQKQIASSKNSLSSEYENVVLLLSINIQTETLIFVKGQCTHCRSENVNKLHLIYSSLTQSAREDWTSVNVHNDDED